MFSFLLVPFLLPLGFLLGYTVIFLFLKYLASASFVFQLFFLPGILPGYTVLFLRKSASFVFQLLFTLGFLPGYTFLLLRKSASFVFQLLFPLGFLPGYTFLLLRKSAFFGFPLLFLPGILFGYTGLLLTLGFLLGLYTGLLLRKSAPFGFLFCFPNLPKGAGIGLGFCGSIFCFFFFPDILEKAGSGNTRQDQKSDGNDARPEIVPSGGDRADGIRVHLFPDEQFLSVDGVLETGIAGTEKFHFSTVLPVLSSLYISEPFSA